MNDEILSVDEVRALPAWEQTTAIRLARSHEALRAALDTAERERDELRQRCEVIADGYMPMLDQNVALNARALAAEARGADLVAALREVRAHVWNGRAERACQVIDAALGEQEAPTEPRGHACEDCGRSVADCDQHMKDHGRGCCAACYSRDTHGLLSAAPQVAPEPERRIVVNIENRPSDDGGFAAGYHSGLRDGRQRR